MFAIPPTTVLAINNGYAGDRGVIEQFRQQYPPRRENAYSVIALTRPTDDWKPGSDPRGHLPPWLRDYRERGLVDDVIVHCPPNRRLLRPEALGEDWLGSEIDKLARRIQQCAGEHPVTEILPPAPYRNEVEVARLAEALDVRWTPVEAAIRCGDKGRVKREVLAPLGAPALEEFECRPTTRNPDPEMTAVREIHEMGYDALIKPMEGIGSAGAVVVERTCDDAEILKRLGWHRDERAALGCDASLVQRCVGDDALKSMYRPRGVTVNELGVHGGKNGDSQMLFLTLKQVTALPYRKETAHFLIPDDPQYSRLREWIAPQMSAMLDGPLGAARTRFNADVGLEFAPRDDAAHNKFRVAFDASHDLLFHYFDLNLRDGGPAIPKLLSASCGTDVAPLLMEFHMSAHPEDAAGQVNSLRPRYAALVRTGFPDGGRVKSGPDPDAVRYIEHMPGVFHVNGGGIESGGDVPALRSRFSLQGHPVIGVAAGTPADAENLFDRALAAFGVTFESSR